MTNHKKTPTVQEIAAQRKCAVLNLTSALAVLEKATCQATMAWNEFQRTDQLLSAHAAVAKSPPRAKKKR